MGVIVEWVWFVFIIYKNYFVNVVRWCVLEVCVVNLVFEV